MNRFHNSIPFKQLCVSFMGRSHSHYSTICKLGSAKKLPVHANSFMRSAGCYYTAKVGVRNFSSLPQKIKQLREATNAPMMECKKALTESNEDVALAMEYLRKQGSAKASSKVAGREANEGMIGLSIDDDNSNGALAKVSSETDFASRSPEFVSLVINVADKGIKAESVELLKKDESIVSQLEETVLAIRENLNITDIRSITSSDSILAGYVHGKSPHSNDVGTSAALVELKWIKDNNSGDKNLAIEAGKKLAMHIVASKPQYLTPQDIPEDIIMKEKAILMEQLGDTVNKKPKEILDKIINGKINKYYSEVCLTEQPHVVEEKSPAVKKVMKAIGLEVKHFEFMSIS